MVTCRLRTILTGGSGRDGCEGGAAASSPRPATTVARAAPAPPPASGASAVAWPPVLVSPPAAGPPEDVGVQGRSVTCPDSGGGVWPSPASGGRVVPPATLAAPPFLAGSPT